MPKLPSDTALLVVDAWRIIGDARSQPQHPEAAHHLAALVAAWRAMRMPLVHVGQSTLIEAGEWAVATSAASAFMGSDLDERLTAAGITTLAVCGAHTHQRVEASVRHASDLGYRVFVAADACAACEVRDASGHIWSAQEVRRFSLAVMGAYAGVTESTALIAAAGAPRPKSWRR